MSDNFAFYLKYRPQALSDLIGQEAVKKNLLSSFQNDKLAHAYLFVGPRGTGKTSLARILAKMVNCSAEQDRPCNKCSVCLSITDGSNLDLIEIDAASNRGIEDIRSLRDKIKLAPTSLRKKVYIIDEVHMLTTEAFNALLKTLEEPPKHALFILATTEGSKVPATILSRVQRLDFKLAKPQEISEALSKIITAEKIDIEEGALKILVRYAAGSFRDGVKLLDQVSSLGKITVKALEENLKMGQTDDLLDLLAILIKKNATDSLLKVSILLENGTDIKELMLSLMEILRSFIFIKNGLGDNLIKQQYTEDKYAELVKCSESFSSQDLVKNLNILQDALEKLKFSSIPSLPLELAIIEICIPLSVIASEAKQSTQGENPAQVASSSSTPRNDDVISEPILEQVPDDKSVSADSPDIQKLKEKWTFVLETIRPINFSLEALLRAVKVTECNENVVIMEVPYSFHQRIMEAPKNRDLLEGVFSDILGRSIRISTILGQRPSRREDIANIEVAADDEIIRAAAEIFNSDSVN